MKTKILALGEGLHIEKSKFNIFIYNIISSL